VLTGAWPMLWQREPSSAPASFLLVRKKEVKGGKGGEKQVPVGAV
jgi:hypothetical protein